VGEYDQLRIKAFEHWTLYLHKSQYFLGRTYAWANREDAGPDDFFHMSKEESAEFIDIGNKVRAALDELWKPDLLNVTFLGNEAPHLHGHLIPRYRNPRQFDGSVFEDKVWGKNPAFYDREADVPLVTKLGIRDIIRYTLNK